MKEEMVVGSVLFNPFRKNDLKDAIQMIKDVVDMRDAITLACFKAEDELESLKKFVGENVVKKWEESRGKDIK